MSRLSENPKANIDLKRPLIHIYRNAPDDFNNRLPVPVLCFMKERQAKHIATESQVATCKICISLAAGRIEDANRQATFSLSEGTRKALKERMVRIQKLIPQVFGD